MTTYAFKDQGGNGLPYIAPGQVLLSRQISLPDLVTNGGLVNSAGADVSLPSTGFAADDILQVFNVPAGTLITQCGVRVTTVEGASCTINVGVTTATQVHTGAADVDGWIAAGSLNAEATIITQVAEGFGPDNYPGIVYVTAGTIDVEFNTADSETAIFDIWAMGAKVF